MKIAFLTQWFQPEPCFKGLPFAKALRDRGHEVTILTGFPNYPEGRLYPGYRIQAWQMEVMDGIKVYRVPLYPSHDSSALRRILNYLSFTASSSLLGPFLIDKPDVLYVFNLPTLAIPAMIISCMHRIPTIYDIQDLWPDSVANSGMFHWNQGMRILDLWCKTVYRKASHLVTLSPGMKAELIKRGVDEKRVSVIYNWCDENHMRPIERDEELSARLGLKNSFVVMFAGTIGAMQGLDVILKVAQRFLSLQPNVKFVFIGGGIERERLMRSTLKHNLDNVLFLERQAPDAMGRIIAIADVMLVHLKDTLLFHKTIPSKVQACMAAGKPILLGLRGDAAEIICVAGAGKVVEPENIDSITNGLIELYHLSDQDRINMGLNAKKHYEDHMSMRAGVLQFEDIFSRMCSAMSIGK